ncbi:MAG TPA: GNAT family N-acetyltransferase [Candidatus Binatia bacterium]|jgi:CelD/BcsL family acetyltransferase involved in cellulose biosynthesis|nr:GNAT family N-acetyltransferase [Candidatus Binatia bacterium]
MYTQLINGSQVFDALSASWNGLLDTAMTATPFQTLAYQKAWWTHLGPGDLHTIVVRNDSDRLCAIACFYLYDGLLYFNGCVEETDYLDLIAPADFAERAWELVFDVLEGTDFPRWQGLHLCNVPDASPSRQILAEIASQRGYGFASEVQEVCPVIDLPGSFDDYLMNLDKKQRHEIRRKMRRAAAASAEFHVVDSGDNLDAAVDEFLRLLQLSTTEKEDWLNPGRRAVFHEVAAAAQRDDQLQLLFLRRGTENAAALYNFDYKGRIWVYNSGFDIVEFGHLSPGVVLTAGSIELAIESGRSTYDFLRGGEEYKYRFGAHDTTIHRLQIDRR